MEAINTINGFRKQTILTDVKLNVSNGIITHEFNVHKLILAATSDYFYALFLGQFKETGRDTIDINDTNPDVFDIFIRIIYGEIITVNDWREQFEILKLLKFFQTKHIDIDGYFKKLTIPPENFTEYVMTLNLLYPEGLSHDLIDSIAGLITPDTDLSQFSDEFITALLTSENYKPHNVMDIFNLIDNLIRIHQHDRSLYSLINYNVIPLELHKQIPEEIIKNYNLGHGIPHITNLNNLINLIPRSINDFIPTRLTPSKPITTIVASHPVPPYRIPGIPHVILPPEIVEMDAKVLDETGNQIQATIRSESEYKYDIGDIIVLKNVDYTKSSGKLYIYLL